MHLQKLNQPEPVMSDKSTSQCGAAEAAYLVSNGEECAPTELCVRPVAASDAAMQGSMMQGSGDHVELLIRVETS